MTSPVSLTAASPASVAQRYALRKKLRPHRAGKPQVWLARDRRLGCDVVAKKYLDPSLSAAWQFEVKLLSLGLPQYPRLLDAFALPGGTFFLAREYLPGESFFDLAASQRGTGTSSSTRKIQAALRQAAGAARLVHALHTARPQAVGLSSAATLADFLIDPTAGLKTGLRLLPALDPQALPGFGVDMRADVARIGELAREMLRLAVEDSSATPPPVAELLHQATNADPDQRHASALWLAHALEQTGEALRDIPKQMSGVSQTAKGFPPPESRLVAAEDTLAYRWLSAGRFSRDIALAQAAHELRELTSIGSDPERLIALDALECDRYPHQLETARQVVSRPEMSAGALLSDEVGLGKTIEALLICRELRARGLANSVLIVASPSGSMQWLSECRCRIRSFAADAAEFHLFTGERDLRRSLLVVTSATLRRSSVLAKLIEARQDDLVIVDEAHQCCEGNAAGGLSRLGNAVARLNRKRLLLLTATPITDNAGQLATLANLIEPDTVDESITFNNPAEPEAAAMARLRSLRARMQAVMVRHRREDLAESLPCPILDVRRVSVRPATLDARVHMAANLVCGQWCLERVVAFCRSPEIRSRLAAEIKRRMPQRRVIEFRGNRREQREQERTFSEYADSVMIAGDKTAEGMNWQRARCLIHVDVPLSPIVWEQRVGRIVRLGQKSKQLQIAHLAAAGEEKLLDLYEHALGLFSLSVGEAAAVLDYAPKTSVGSLERAFRAMLNEPESDHRRYDALASMLRRARAAYDRQISENKLLDDLFCSDFPPRRPSECDPTHLGDQENDCLARMESCVHAVIRSCDSEPRLTRPGSGAWIASYVPESPLAPIGRAFTGMDCGALLYTFDPNRWEAGSRLQCFTPQSSAVKRLTAWALSNCAVVEAHAASDTSLVPHLAAAFCLRIEDRQARESIEWLMIDLANGSIKRLDKSPLNDRNLLPGRPPHAHLLPASDALTRAFRSLTGRFNSEASGELGKRSAATPTPPKLETTVVGAALLWLPLDEVALPRPQRS